MKKLILIALLLIQFIAGAQEITEKMLLGEWTIEKLDMNGAVANFVTGEVTTEGSETGTPPAQEELDYLKDVITSSEGLMNQKVVFKPKSELEMSEGQNVHKGTFELLKEKEQQFVVFYTTATVKMQAVMQKSYLKLIMTGDAVGVMYLKKKKKV